MIAGIPVPLAIGAAIVGNVVSMLVFVFVADAARRRVLAGRETVKELSPRQERLKRAFDRFGVPGVSIVGPTILASQITASLMVSFGAPRNAVIVWQCVAIVLWGLAFGLLALAGANLLALR